jgi:hypothetical protein
MNGNEELVLNAIERVKPDWLSNSMIESQSGLRHQQVCQITRRLMKAGLIEGEQSGHEWFFRSPSPLSRRVEPMPMKATQPPKHNPDRACSLFESRARETLSSRLRTSLVAGKPPNVPKKFNLVSTDGTVV